MSDRDEYQFYPEDFDDDGNLSEAESESDPAPLVIIGCFGVGVGLLITSFFVDSFGVFGTEISSVGAATAMFAFGLVVGGGSYLRQGRFWLGAIHIGGAFGWLFIVLGTRLSHSIAVAVGTAVLVVGGAVLLGFLWRSSS